MISTFRKKLLTAAILATLGVPAFDALAQETPTLAEPSLQQKLEANRAELTKYRANPTAYFQMPASGVPVPCAAAETGIKASVGIVDWTADPVMQRAMAKAARSTGMVKNAMTPPTFTDVKLVVVKAPQCDGDAAVGDYEAWVDYTMVMDTPQFTNINPYLVHVTGKFARGEARAVEAMTARRAGATVSKWKDPATAEMMAKVPPTKIVLIAMQSTDKQGSVVLTSTTVNGKESVTTSATDVKVAGGETRTHTRMFTEATLTNDSRYKDGTQHGPQMSYPYFNKQFNVQIPGGMLCFDDGEQIKTTKCDIE